MYEFLASHYEAVVSIALSARVSGAYNAAAAGTRRISAAPDERRVISVIDSLNVSLGQGLVAITAAERAGSGGSADEVMVAANRGIAHARTLALLATVDNAVKGGRVARLVRTIADLLRLSVMLARQADGGVTLGGLLWESHNLRARFSRHVARQLGQETAGGKNRHRLLVGHANAASEAQASRPCARRARRPKYSDRRLADAGRQAVSA